MVSIFSLVSSVLSLGLALDSFRSTGILDKIASIVKYSAPLIAMYSFLVMKKVKIRKGALIVFFLFLVPICLSLINKGKITFYAVRDVSIVLSLLLIFIVDIKIKLSDINLYFFFSIILLFLEIVGSGFDYNKNFGLLSTFNSHPFFESSTNFVFTAYAIFYIKERNHVLSAVAIFFMLLCAKRIGLGAFVIALTGQYFFSFFRLQKRDLLLKESVFLLSSFYFLLFYIAINIASIIEWFFKNSNIQYSVNAFMMGRAYIAVQLLKYLENSSTSQFLFGYGVGAASEFLDMINLGGRISHLHNDYFKIYYEFGVVGCLLIGLGFLKMCGNYSRNVGIFIFYMIISITDNTFIYIGFLYPMYLMFYYNRQKVENL